MESSGRASVRGLMQILARKSRRWASTLTVFLVVGMVLAGPLRQAALDVQLFFRVRDELLSKSPEGQRYIELSLRTNTEICRLFQSDLRLAEEGVKVLVLWQPNLQALLDGKGSKAIIKRSQVYAVLTFLDHLSAAGSPELKQIIADERARRPLEPLVGKSMDEAYAILVLQPSAGIADAATATWFSPPMNYAPQEWMIGATIPIEFDLLDDAGYPIIDQSTTLTILDEQGRSVFGAIEVGKDPARSLVVQGTRYHYDFRTSGLPAGIYAFNVASDSIGPNRGFGYGLKLADEE